MDFADIYPFLVALLIGTLIGTERQRRLVEDKVRGVAGLRTFILISLLGALCADLAGHYGPNFAIAAISTFTILVAAGYASAVSSLGRIDFTAAVAAVVTFALGMLTSFPDSVPLAVALAIITTWVLATRTITHHYVEVLSETDLLDTLKMGIIALVIYPLLPEAPLGPWGVINLRQIWLFVIMVSLIGYVGYILIRILGAERGLSLTGILGGLVSSTAVTSSMAAEVEGEPADNVLCRLRHGHRELYHVPQNALPHRRDKQRPISGPSADALDHDHSRRGSSLSVSSEETLQQERK